MIAILMRFTRWAVVFQLGAGFLIDVIIGEMNRPGTFDFGDRAFVNVLRDQGMEIGQDRASSHMPPIEMLFAQRKISGTALLAARLKAQIDVVGLVEAFRG
ncbi:hypothetical protein [Sphingomonas sp. 28-62-11]|uniref:hypothetical protein n=1 Tax=Sphingomonas sp. 28-62-11 TaxID=1970432 RepID=UPI0035A91C97